ncbi:MAG: hypothetical protein MN733_29845 [Nitrososphaera sp.]|nr:hypothetical protein [Nitrososphaera sp.]
MTKNPFHLAESLNHTVNSPPVAPNTLNRQKAYPPRLKETKSLVMNGGKYVTSGFVNYTRTVIRYEKLLNK